jgi:hypothetical protein
MTFFRYVSYDLLQASLVLWRRFLGTSVMTHIDVFPDRLVFHCVLFCVVSKATTAIVASVATFFQVCSVFNYELCHKLIDVMFLACISGYILFFYIISLFLCIFACLYYTNEASRFMFRKEHWFLFVFFLWAARRLAATPVLIKWLNEHNLQTCHPIYTHDDSQTFMFLLSFSLCCLACRLTAIPVLMTWLSGKKLCGPALSVLATSARTTSAVSLCVSK